MDVERMPERLVARLEGVGPAVGGNESVVRQRRRCTWQPEPQPGARAWQARAACLARRRPLLQTTTPSSCRPCSLTLQLPDGRALNNQLLAAEGPGGSGPSVVSFRRAGRRRGRADVGSPSVRLDEVALPRPPSQADRPVLAHSTPASSSSSLGQLAASPYCPRSQPLRMCELGSGGVFVSRASAKPPPLADASRPALSQPNRTASRHALSTWLAQARRCFLLSRSRPGTSPGFLEGETLCRAVAETDLARVSSTSWPSPSLRRVPFWAPPRQARRPYICRSQTHRSPTYLLDGRTRPPRAPAHPPSPSAVTVHSACHAAPAPLPRDAPRELAPALGVRPRLDVDARQARLLGCRWGEGPRRQPRRLGASDLTPPHQP